MITDEHKLIKSDLVVFLTGAGASVDLGLPVMNLFLDEARRRFFDSYVDDSKRGPERNSLQSLLSFHALCQNTTWAFERNWDNLEELYTQADLMKVVEQGSADNDIVKICEDMAWAIWDIYRAPCKARLKPLNVLGISHAIRRSALVPTFITTNYDVGVEQSLLGEANTDQFAYPGFHADAKGVSRFTGEELNSLGAVLSSRRTPVIKLHGSVNWFTAAEDRSKVHALIGRSTVENNRRTLPIANGGIARSKIVTENSFDIPLIVPPALSKVSTSSAIAYQWRSAVEAFQRAREIWIVGYSFPTTDPFMLRLLHQGLSRNNQLEKLIIADIADEESWRERLQMFNSTFRRGRVRYYQVEARLFFHYLNDEKNWPNAEIHLENCIEQDGK